MSFLLPLVNFIGSLLEKVAPYFFAYLAGKKEAEYDFNESVRKVLEEDNEELRAAAVMPPSAKSEFLRARAAKKRKDQD